MTEPSSFRAQMRQLLRGRALDATGETVAARGWSSVTMTHIAARVGVSRQALYKEMGDKQQLGLALIARETDRFLTEIVGRLQLHPDDPVAGVTAAAELTLREAPDNVLLKAIVSADDGADLGLLPLLSVRTEPVLQRAVAAMTAQARDLYPDALVGDVALATAVDVVVRLTLSHLLHSAGPVQEAVGQIRHVASRLLPAPA